MTDLWDLLPTRLKWVLFVSGWIVVTLQNLWRKLPDNLYVFGAVLRRTRPDSRWTLRWSNKPMIAWGEDANEASRESDEEPNIK